MSSATYFPAISSLRVFTYNLFWSNNFLEKITLTLEGFGPLGFWTLGFGPLGLDPWCLDPRDFGPLEL